MTLGFHNIGLTTFTCTTYLTHSQWSADFTTYCQRGRYSQERHVHSFQVVLPAWHDS